MSSISEIEAAVQHLNPEELSAFRNWFAEFDADTWDRQIEEDALAGKLDSLGEEAIGDLREGKCTDL